MQNHVEPNNKKHWLGNNKHIVFESLGITAITLGVAFLIDEALGKPQDSLADYVVVLEENTTQSHQPNQTQANPVNNHVTQKDHVSEQQNTNPSLLVDVNNHMDTNNLSLKKIQEDLDDLNKEVEQIMRSEKQTDQHDYSITRNDEPAMGKTPTDMIKLPGHNAPSNPTEDAQIDLTEQNFSQARSEKDGSHKGASNEEDTASDSSFFNSPLGYLTGAGIAGVGTILGTSLSGDTPPGGSALQAKSTNLIKSGTPTEKNIETTEKNIETTEKNNPQVPQIQTFKSIIENRADTPAPDFTLTDVLGDEYSLYESFLNQDKIVVMDFYATWCPHCQTLRDSGLLSSLAEEYGDKVVVITIEAASNSTHDDLIEFFGGSLEGHSELIFEETSLNSTFGLQYFPTLFAISTTGEMLDFGSVRTEFTDHHQLYKELVAYEYAYGTVEETKEDNVAKDLGDDIATDKVDSDNANQNIQPEPQTMEIFDSVLANSYTQPAPDFTLTDVFSDEYSLYESFLDEGKVAVIDFYAAWCPHCQSLRDTGLLSSLAEEYADDVVVITIEAALNSDHDDLIEFFGGSLEGHSELIFEETSLNSTFGLQYFPTLFAVSSTGEMLNFGSARAEFADHHALYQELMAYEYIYGNLEGDKPDNGNAVACDIDGESEGCGIPTVSGEWENFPSECGEGILYEGTKTVTDFTLTDVAGNIHTFSEEQVQGTYVLINFFSAGCSHCMEGCEDDTALNQILANHDDVIIYHIELDLKTPTEQLEFGFDGYDWSKLHNGVDEFVFNVTDDERTTIMSSYIIIEELETCGYPGLYFINSDFEMATIDRDEVSGDELYQLITAYIGPLSTQQNSTENANMDVVLHLDNLTDTSIDIVYEAQVPIQAYQFSLTLNGQIDSVTTDSFDIIHFKEQQPGIGEHIAIGLSSAGTTLPAGSATLATISFTADTGLALNDFILADEIIISNQVQVSSGIAPVAEEKTDETEVIVVEEQPVEDETPVILDKTKNLLWTEYDESTQDLSVYVNLVEQACGFQMNVQGYEILDTGIGFAEDAGYMHTFRDSKVLGYSMSGDAIDPDEGVLTTLNIQPNAGHDAAPQLMNVMLVGCDDSFTALSIENLSAQEAAPQAVVEEVIQPVTEDVVTEEEVPPVTKVVVEETTDETEVVEIEEQPVEDETPVILDKTKNLLWTEYDESAQDLSVYVNLVEQSCGFQMNVQGYEILDTGIGFAEDAGYMHTFRDGKVLGYSMSGDAIDPDEGVLTTLNIQPNAGHDAAPQLMNVMLVGCDDSFTALSIENLSAQEAAPQAVVEEVVQPVTEDVVTEEEVPSVAIVTDADVVLSLNNLTSQSIDIIYEAQVPIQAYQFSLALNGQIDSITTDDFDIIQFQEQQLRSGEYIALGLSSAGTTLPAGSATLATITFTSENALTLNDFTLSGEVIISNQVQISSGIAQLDDNDANLIVEETTDETEVVVVEEQPVEDETPVILDKTKNLLWTEYDESAQDLSVYVNLVEQSCGFQMNVQGYEILDTGIGFAEDAGYMHTFRDGKVLGYSMTVNAIAPGEGVLTTLNIQPNAGHDIAPQLMDVILVGCDNSFAALSIENLSTQEAAPQAAVEEVVQPVTEDVVTEEEVPPVAIVTDADVVLSLNNLTSQSIDIIYEAQVPIQAYQFSLALNGQIDSITTDDFDIIQFQEQQLRSGEYIALGLSSAGTTLPAGSATLATITFTSENALTLNDFTLSNELIISNEAEVSSSIAPSSNNVNNNTPDDLTVVLSLDNFTSNSIEVMYETQQPIQAYAFKLSFDGQINNAITSEFDNIQILETAPDSSEFYVLGFSNTGATLPLGSHTLASIEFTANSDLQLSDFVLSNETLFANTERLNSTIIELNNDQEPTIVTPAANTVDTTANSATVATDAPYELNYFRSLVDAGTQSAPDFKLTDLDGNEIDLYADYLDQGTPVILELFATWCSYCKAFAQGNILADLATDYGDEVQVIMVEASGSSTRADLDTFLANPDYNLQDEIIIESTEINSAYGLQYFPTLFAINTEGEMINWGSVRNSLSTAEDLFKEILAFEAATTVNTAPTTDNAVAIEAATADDAIEINVTINQPSIEDYAGTSFGWHIGDEMFNFEVIGEQGNITTLYDILDAQGNPETVFFNSFSSWCSYSKQYAEEVDTIYDSIQQHNLVNPTNTLGFVSIMLDNADKEAPTTIDMANWLSGQVAGTNPLDMPLHALAEGREVFTNMYEEAADYVDLNTASPYYSILSKQEHIDGSLGYVLADEPYPTIQPGQAMIDLIENFVAPEDMSPVADHLSSLCEQGQACFIMLGDIFTTASSSTSEVTITDEFGQTLLSSDNIEWTPNETISGTHLILTLDEIPTSATTFNFNLTDSEGNGWSDANSGPGEIAGGIWLHHPNGDTELLHLFNEGFEKNLEITLHPEDDDSIF